jgi:hypothetical protein
MITFFSILQSNRAVTSSSKERWKKLPGSQPAVAARHHAAGWMLPPPDLIQGKDRRWSGCAVRKGGGSGGAHRGGGDRESGSQGWQAWRRALCGGGRVGTGRWRLWWMWTTHNEQGRRRRHRSWTARQPASCRTRQAAGHGGGCGGS